VDSSKDVPFAVKSKNFIPPDSQPPKRSNFGKFLDRKFLLISRLTLGVSRVNTPYSSSEPNRSVIVNRQCGGEKFKYVAKFYIESTGHVISRMRNEDLHWTGNLSRISQKRPEIESWLQWSTHRKCYIWYQMVTRPMTSRYIEMSPSWPKYMFWAQYLANRWWYRVGYNGLLIGNAIWGITWPCKY